MFDRLSDYNVDGKIEASGYIRGKQADRMGDAVMLGINNLIPKRFLHDEDFLSTLLFNQTTFATDDAGCLTYANDAQGMTPVTNINNNLDVGSFDFYTNLLSKDCMYATFDGTEMLSELNPYNLNEDLDGRDTSDEIKNYNTMFVIPKRYLSGNDNSLNISNISKHGTAYAHTFEGQEYNNYAIGVYEGSMKGGKLMSVSNAVPARNTTRPDFRTAVQANGQGWHLMNYHGRRLIRDMTLFAIKRFDSQRGLGQGFSSGGNADTNPEGLTTGLLNTTGPFAGNVTATNQPVKCYIENPWGSKWEFIDDLVCDIGYGNAEDGYFVDLYVGQNLLPDDLLSNKVKIASLPVVNITASQNYFCTQIKTSDAGWGLWDNNAGSDASGLCDRHWANPSAQGLGLAGGGSAYGSGCGVSALRLAGSFSGSSWTFGSRPAFVFD